MMGDHQQKEVDERKMAEYQAVIEKLFTVIEVRLEWYCLHGGYKAPNNL